MSENKKTKLNYMVELQPKEYEPGNTPIEGPEDFDYSEKAEQNLSSAENIKPSLAHAAGNLVMDIATPAIGGAVIGAGAGLRTGKKDARDAIWRAQTGKDSGSRIIHKIADKSNERTDELNKVLDDNKKIAAAFANKKISPKKALSKVLKNTEKEAEIGPNFVEDIFAVLAKDTNKSPKEVKKALKDFVNKNKNNLNDVTLLAAKDNVTFGHSVRVGKLAKKVALEAGLSEEAAENLAQAAFVHDMGKIGIPDRVTNSIMRFDEHPELREIMNSHDTIGGEIFEKVNPYWSKIAKEHHPNHGHGTSDDSQLVTISDLYDAITSSRSYKTSHDKNFALNDPAGILYNIGKGETTEDYLNILRSLDKKGLLPEYYEVENDLADIFPALRANKIKDQIRDYYKKIRSLDDAAFGLQAGTFAGLAKYLPEVRLPADKGTIDPSQLPSVSEIKEELFPSSRDRKELIDDINRWYKKGLFENNPEAIKVIANTDFGKTKEIRKLWKYLDKIRKSHN